MAGEAAGFATHLPRKVLTSQLSGRMDQERWTRGKEADAEPSRHSGSQTGSQGAPDISAQLKNCAHNGDVELSETLLEKLLKDDGTVSVDDYNYVIHACATARDVIRAEGHLSSMISRGLHPNLVSFNSVINACAMDGDVVRAELWLSRMVQCGVKPTEVTFGTICKVLARQGLVSEIQGVMKEVEKQGLCLNEYFYASLISACGVASPRNVKEAMRAFEDLLSRGLRAQSVKKALERVLGQRETASLFARTGATRRSALPPSHSAAGSSPVAGQTPLASSEDSGSARGRSDTKSSTDSNPRADRQVYSNEHSMLQRPSPALSSPCSGQREAPGLGPEPWKVLPDPRTIKLGRGSDGDSDRSTGPGSLPGSLSGGNNNNLATQLRNASRSGDVSLSEYLLQVLLKEQGSVTVEDYNCVIHACATARDVLRAEHHLNRMASVGISPDSISFDLVIRSYIGHGDLSMAHLWLERMMQYGLRPREATVAAFREALAQQSAGAPTKRRNFSGEEVHSHLQGKLGPGRVAHTAPHLGYYAEPSAFSRAHQGSTSSVLSDEFGHLSGGFISQPTFQSPLEREIIRV